MGIKFSNHVTWDKMTGNIVILIAQFETLILILEYLMHYTYYLVGILHFTQSFAFFSKVEAGKRVP